MINQRKKKPKSIQLLDSTYDNTWEASGTAAWNGGSGSNLSGAGKDVPLEERMKQGSNSELAKYYNAAVSSIQERADDRAAAEESNLDILDRGSRYTRKNEKLKKFKGTKKAEA